MKIYLGADHAGFTLKEKVKKYFDKNKIDYVDMSKKKVDSDDYPDVAFKLGERVSAEKVKGILFCGSGSGVAIAVNKVKGIRAASAYDEETAKLSREHGDSNILTLSGWKTNSARAKKIVDVWLNTKFSNIERHKRRIKKIEEYENANV
ncbi:RpiB/LacA/LacB family sugar-phosphate isomerase [Candidatus Pacearchaeota archaeon]|nr:RpiB/LacA/LacB family sugar-phosphate isomerase [Candidatus Pacearchaeota archaeon]